MRVAAAIFFACLIAFQAVAGNSSAELCAGKRQITRADLEIIVSNVNSWWLDTQSESVWNIKGILEGVADHWGWFEDNRKARTDYLDSINTIIEFREVDRAASLGLRYTCAYWRRAGII